MADLDEMSRRRTNRKKSRNNAKHLQGSKVLIESTLIRLHPKTVPLDHQDDNDSGYNREKNRKRLHAVL
jgi:hypothetical protein